MKIALLFFLVIGYSSAFSQASFTSSNGIYYFIDPKNENRHGVGDDLHPYDEFGQSVANAKLKFESRYVVKSKGTGAYSVDVETIQKKRIFQAIQIVSKSIRQSVDQAELSAEEAAKLLTQYYTVAYEIFPLETRVLEDKLKDCKKDVSKITFEVTTFYRSIRNETMK